MGPARENGPIVVIGAGVIGLAIAFRFARSGEQVLLLDTGDPGRQASWGNAGHIATEQVFPLASPNTLRQLPRLLLGGGVLSVRAPYALQIVPWLLRFGWASRPSAYRAGVNALGALQAGAMESMQRLLTDAGVGALLHRRGHLILVESETRLASAKAQIELFHQHGIECEWLNPLQVRKLAPELPHRIAGAIYLLNTGHVTNPFAVCEGLMEAFHAAGGRFERRQVANIVPQSDGGLVVSAGEHTVKASAVVVAAGAWSAPFAAQLGSKVPLDTERGYNVTAEGFTPRFDVSIASLDRMTIMTPMDCGLRITGFVEFGGLSLPASRKKLARLEMHLRQLLPRSDMRGFSRWLGFRPSLPDHLPVIGRSERFENAYFAFGHQHLGLTLAGITAEAIYAQFRRRQGEVDLHPFRAGRFG